jgi:predicted acyl esterase
MRPAFDTLKQAAILFHSIYAMDRDTVILERAAKQGYISVLSYSRGKVKSNNEITPYETEMEDVNIVID